MKHPILTPLYLFSFPLSPFTFSWFHLSPQQRQNAHLFVSCTRGHNITLNKFFQKNRLRDSDLSQFIEVGVNHHHWFRWGKLQREGVLMSHVFVKNWSALKLFCGSSFSSFDRLVCRSVRRKQLLECLALFHVRVASD